MIKSSTLHLQNPLFHFFLIVAICLIAYSNTLNAPLQFDDIPVIVENPIVKDLGFMVNPSEAKVYKGTFEYELFRRRYVGYLTFALNYRLHKLDTAGYHVVNLYLHIINALIVYWLVILTFRTPFLSSSTLKELSNQVALFASLLFASHPVQTQAVNYIWQRVTILAATFYVLSLVMYIKWKLASKKTGSLYHRMPLLFYLGAVIAAVLAMKTKEIAFTLPVVILLYELMFFDGKLKKRFLYLIPLFLTMLIIPANLLEINKPIGVLISDVSEATRVHTSMSRWDYLLTQFAVIVTYIRLIFLPVNQNIDYDYPIYNTFLTPEVFLSFLVLLCIFGCGVYLFLHSRNRNSTFRLIAFGIFWFFITLSVESSFIPLMNVIFEHRIYLPSVGFFMALTSGIFLLLNKLGQRKSHTIGVAIFTAVIIVLSVFTYSKNNVWSSEIALWRDCVEKSPQKHRDYINLGRALAKKGKYDEAIGSYLQALRIKPNDEKAHSGIGIVLKNQGRIEEAIDHYLQALRLKPDYEKAHNNLGVALFHKGNIEGAIFHFRAALRLKPYYAAAQSNLMKVLALQKENKKTIAEIQRAPKFMNTNPTFYFKQGGLFKAKGELDDAIEQYQKALSIKQEFIPALNDLALAYVEKGEYGRAFSLYQKIIKLNPDSYVAYYNIACMYAKQNKIEDSVDWLKKAVKKGFKDWKFLKTDQDLENIRGSSYYKKLASPTQNQDAN